MHTQAENLLKLKADCENYLVRNKELVIERDTARKERDSAKVEAKRWEDRCCPPKREGQACWREGPAGEASKREGWWAAAGRGAVPERGLGGRDWNEGEGQGSLGEGFSWWSLKLVPAVSGMGGPEGDCWRGSQPRRCPSLKEGRMKMKMMTLPLRLEFFVIDGLILKAELFVMNIIFIVRSVFRGRTIWMLFHFMNAKNLHFLYFLSILSHFNYSLWGYLAPKMAKYRPI